MQATLQPAKSRLSARGNWSIRWLGGPVIESGLSELAAEIRATSIADQDERLDCYDNSANGGNEWVIFRLT